jgi:hypothetical protein
MKASMRVPSVYTVLYIYVFYLNTHRCTYIYIYLYFQPLASFSLFLCHHWAEITDWYEWGREETKKNEEKGGGGGIGKRNMHIHTYLYVCVCNEPRYSMYVRG